MREKILTWLRQMSFDANLPIDVKIFMLGIQNGMETEEVSKDIFRLAYKQMSKMDQSQLNTLYNFGRYMGITHGLLESIKEEYNDSFDLHSEKSIEKDDTVA